MRKYYSNIDEMHNAQLTYSAADFTVNCGTTYCCGTRTIQCTITDTYGDIAEKMVLCSKCAENQVITTKQQNR